MLNELDNITYVVQKVLKGKKHERRLGQRHFRPPMATLFFSICHLVSLR